MKIDRNVLVGTLAAWLLLACSQETSTTTEEADTAADAKPALGTLDERFSYIIGMNIGRQIEMQYQDINVNTDALALGLKDSLSETGPQLSEAEVQQVIQEFQQKQQDEFVATSTANKEAGEAFLSANSEKEGVVVLDSGLQYKVITEGSGAKPVAENRVTVHYRGSLIDGTEFDSSYTNNQPATFPLNGVISGWTEGVQLMSEGAKYEFYIPPEMAYGADGRPPVIPPNSTLVFEVELLQANADETAAEEN